MPGYYPFGEVDNIRQTCYLVRMDETKETLPQGMLDVSLHIKVDYQTWQQLIALADQNDRSLSAEVRRAIRLYLEAQ